LGLGLLPRKRFLRNLVPQHFVVECGRIHQSFDGRNPLSQRAGLGLGDTMVRVKDKTYGVPASLG
jgi:hypothetical protein